MPIEKLWLSKYEEFGGLCVYCAKDLLLDVDFFMCGQLDHLIPEEALGPDTPANKVTACFVCNNLKGKFDPRTTGARTQREMIDVARTHIFAERAKKARDLRDYKERLKRPNKALQPTTT